MNLQKRFERFERSVSNLVSKLKSLLQSDAAEKNDAIYLSRDDSLSHLSLSKQQTEQKVQIYALQLLHYARQA